jgi:predicted DNA repair protein MutK
LNAQQVTGVAADRELPVVWAVARGSLINKVILVPAALLISAFIPWAVTPLLMVGGAFLCYEGFEKLAHHFLHSPVEEVDAQVQQIEAVVAGDVDLVTLEKEKIKGAVRTDFVLSAEIIAITLGTVQQSPFVTQVAVLCGIALVMTIGVYGLVAGIVKLDDVGLYLSQRREAGDGWLRALGRGILSAAPWLMKGLSVAGTAAMFLVGGGILTHGVPALHHALQELKAAIEQWPGLGAVASWLADPIANALFGIVAGGVVLALVSAVQRVRRR